MVFVAPPTSTDAGKRLAQRQIVCASRGGNAKATAPVLASSQPYIDPFLDSLEARPVVWSEAKYKREHTVLFNWVDRLMKIPI